MPPGYRYLTRFLLLLPAVMIAGFWVPYFGEVPHFDPSVTYAVHLHALALFGWVVLLLLQPFLIVNKAYQLHRTLGRATYLLMPCIVVLSIAMMHKEYGENVLAGRDARSALEAEYLSATQLALLTIFYLLAIHSILKRRVQAHMQFMLCTVLIVLPAGLSRTLGYWVDLDLKSSQTICLLFINVVLVGLALYGRVHRVAGGPYVAALAAYTVVEMGWAALGRAV